MESTTAVSLSKESNLTKIVIMNGNVEVTIKTKTKEGEEMGEANRANPKTKGEPSDQFNQDPEPMDLD